MDRPLVISKITSAINVLTAARGEAAKLPQRHQRNMVGLSSFDAAIYGLELAKAEILGEPKPAAPVVNLPADAMEYIDNA